MFAFKVYKFFLNNEILLLLHIMDSLNYQINKSKMAKYCGYVQTIGSLKVIGNVRCWNQLMWNN